MLKGKGNMGGFLMYSDTCCLCVINVRKYIGRSVYMVTSVFLKLAQLVWKLAAHI